MNIGPFEHSENLKFKMQFLHRPLSTNTMYRNLCEIVV